MHYKDEPLTEAAGISSAKSKQNNKYLLCSEVGQGVTHVCLWELQPYFDIDKWEGGSTTVIIFYNYLNTET